MKKNKMKHGSTIVSDREQEVYNEIYNHLNENGVYMEIDRVSIILAAKCYVRVEAIEQKLSDIDALIEIYESGVDGISALYSVLSSERKTWMVFCQHFGLTQYGRDKMKSFLNKSKNGVGIVSKIRELRGKKLNAV